MNHESTDNEDLPAELIMALKARELPADVIASRVDRAVMAAADTHFGVEVPEREQRGPGFPRLLLAAAAGVAAVSVALLLAGRDPVLSRDDLYTDVDGSGQIDIADVLLLAKEGEGITDDELDAFAASVVRLFDGDPS